MQGAPDDVIGHRPKAYSVIAGAGLVAWKSKRSKGIPDDDDEKNHDLDPTNRFTMKGRQNL